MSDEEYEEDEFIVYADFGSHLTSDDINDENIDIKIIGIDNEHPIIEANGKIFKGSYNLTVGTHVLFEKDNNPPSFDPLYDKKPPELYKLLAKTNKVLEMNRIFLEKESTQETKPQEEEPSDLQELKARLEVKSTYAEALNMFLPPGATQYHSSKREHRDSESICDDNSSMDDDDASYNPEIDINT